MQRLCAGFGGQIDFIRGASVSHDGRGKPIIALPSVAGKAKRTKIVPTIQDVSICQVFLQNSPYLRRNML